MSWESADPTRDVGDDRRQGWGRRPRRWGFVLLGVCVLGLALLAGLLLPAPSSGNARSAESAAAFDRVLTLLAELEAAERGYLLNGREDDARAQEAAAHEIEALVPLVVGPRARLGPDATRSALEALAAQMLAASRERVRLRREQGPEATRAGSRELALTSEQVRTILREVAAEQRMRLDAREAELGAQLRLRTAIALGIGLATVLAAGLALATALPPRPRASQYVEVGLPEPLPPLDAAGRIGETFRALLDTLEDAVVAVDEHGRVFASNAAAEAALGLGESRPGAGERDEVYGLYLPDSPSPTSGRDSPILRALKGENVQGAVFYVGPSDKEGSRRVKVYARPVRSGTGRQVRGAVIVLKDVTDLQRAEAARQESEEKYGSLFRSAPFGVVSMTLDGRIQSANPAFCRLLGYSAEHLVGREAATLTRRPDLDREAALARELLAGERDSYQLEKRCRTGEDVTRWLRWTVSAVRDVHGKVLVTLASVDDATELRRLEWTARRSQELLRAVVDALPVGVWIVDRGGSVRLSNAAGRRIWTNKGDILRFPDGDYKGWWADSGKRIEPSEWGALHAIESGEIALDKIIEVQRFDGTFRKLLTSAFPFRRPDGSIGGAIVVNHEITTGGWTSDQRLRLESELHQAILQASELRGLLPVCPLCDKKREDPAYWKRVHSWIGEHIADMREHACRECQSRSYDLPGDLLEGKPASKS